MHATPFSNLRRGYTYFRGFVSRWEEGWLLCLRGLAELRESPMALPVEPSRASDFDGNARGEIVSGKISGETERETGVGSKGVRHGSQGQATTEFE